MHTTPCRMTVIGIAIQRRLLAGRLRSPTTASEHLSSRNLVFLTGRNREPAMAVLGTEGEFRILSSSRSTIQLWLFAPTAVQADDLPVTVTRPTTEGRPERPLGACCFRGSNNAYCRRSSNHRQRILGDQSERQLIENRYSP